MKKIALIAAFALAVPVAAETIRMRDGSYHAGEVVSSDDEVVRIRFSATGLELDLKWEQLAPGEAKRIRARAAVEKAARFKIEGEVVYTKNDTIEGVVQEETPDKLRIKTAKGMRDVMKTIVLKRETTQINALSVYTPDELYASKSSQYDLATTAGNFDLGDLCLAISLWEKAKEHFTKSLELDPTWKARIEPRLAKAESGIREEAAAALLKEAEALFKEDKLEEGLDKLKEVLDRYPGTSAASKAAELSEKGSDDLGALKADQKKETDAKRAKAYYDEMNSLVRKVASDKKLTFTDIKGYIEKVMTGEILDKMAEREKCDRTQLEADWKSRDLPDWKQASYGEGSWMLEPDTLAIEATTNLDDIRNKQKNQQLIADLKKQAGEQRKLVDEWWAKQTTTVKINWLTAYAAEKTMITKPVEHQSCTKCNAKGVLGGTNLCLRCLGTGKDRVVFYK
ncbi:MAG: hypothetical protein HYY18_08600 [Planctomycetes bacterium]|nr:hypothetical protein [Planctomycetota bacterium]